MRPLAWPLAAAAFLAARPAQAHLVETGFGAFYDGLAHVVLTPADLLVAVALALLAGQRGTSAARRASLALPLAWLAGGLIGARWPAASAFASWTTASFLIAGALVAMNARIRDAVVVALAVAAGLLHGAVNGATLAPSGAIALALCGAVTAVFVVVVLAAAELTPLPPGWPRSGMAYRPTTKRAWPAWPGCWTCASATVRTGAAPGCAGAR